MSVSWRTAVPWPLALVVLVGSGCGDEPKPAGAVDRSAAAEWTVDATLLKTSVAPLKVCHSVLDSLPPAACGGVVLRDVDLDSAPGATRYPNGTVTTDRVRVTGTFKDGVLRATEPLRRAPAPAPRPGRGIPGPSCPEPAGGWPLAKATSNGKARVNQYVMDAPDGGSSRIDRTQHIITASFTGDLERHRRELAALYDGPLCVELAKASRRQLEALEVKLVDEVKDLGYGYLGSSSGNAWGTVDITVMAATDDQCRALAEAHDDLVTCESFLRPAD